MTPNSYTLSYAATGTAQTAAVYVSENGFAPVVIADASDLGGTKTVTITVLDANGYVVFSSGALTGGSIYYFGRIDTVSYGTVPMHPSFTIVGTLSEAWGGTGGSVPITFYVDCNRGD
jgi:hypothetical protein